MTTFSTIPSTLQFCQAPLPRGLRERAAHLTWDAFIAAHTHHSGPVRLDEWRCADARETSRCLGPQARAYQATLTIGDRTRMVGASASGPIAALTAMLYEQGVGVEVLDFHQVQMGRDTITYIRGGNGLRDEWAMAWAEDPTQSALRAVIGCANGLDEGASPAIDFGA